MSTLVNFGGDWSPKDEDRSWFSVSVSSTGLYQTAVDYGGKIYVSSDYGNTWTPKDENRNWYSVSISSTGQYQTVVIANGGQIYVSDDYGNTWTPKDENRMWRSVSISSTGEYQTVVVSGGGKIYVSYAAILNPPMPFYLPQLDVSVNSLSALLLGESSSVFSGDATVAVDILLENAMNIFQFQSDSTDINNVTANDIKYRVVYTGDSSYNMVFNIDTSSNVIVNSIYSGAANNNATYDYVRYLAQQLFNTHLGVDLFSNESDLRQDLMDAFSTSFTSNMTRLHAVETDASGNSPSKTILNEIINNHPERLNDISSLAVGNNWFKCPLVVGDILYFCLTVKAAANQNTITNVVAIPDRVYLIKVTLLS